MMLSETSAALRDAGASEKEIAGFENRLVSIDNPLSRLEARYSMLRWMVGVNVAATLAILRRRFAASVVAAQPFAPCAAARRAPAGGGQNTGLSR